VSTESQTIITITSDVADCHFEIEIPDWNSADSVLPFGEVDLCLVDDSFAAYQRHVTRQLGEAFGSKPIHQGRKTCLSCGAVQDFNGVLPCGH
jgi:hypothetical protein